MVVERIQRAFLKRPVTKEKLLSVSARELNQTVALYKTVVALLKVLSKLSSHTECHLLTLILILCT